MQPTGDKKMLKSFTDIQLPKGTHSIGFFIMVAKPDDAVAWIADIRLTGPMCATQIRSKAKQYMGMKSKPFI